MPREGTEGKPVKFQRVQLLRNNGRGGLYGVNEVEERRMSNVHWNEEIALSYMEYLLSGSYPDSYRRRNFRKRATDFEVMDRQLYYNGCSRLALYKSKDGCVSARNFVNILRSVFKGPHPHSCKTSNL